MNVFEAVKQSVTTRQAAEHYGVRVGRNGMCVCPFHDDKNPSMKVDRRFHCFGCQADGDVIDFVSRLEAVSPKEAASCWRRSSPSPMRTGNHPAGENPNPGRKPRNSGFAAWSVTASGCCPIITIFCAAGNGTMPLRCRKKHGTRFLWKPCRSNPMWNICWMCCSPRIWRNGQSLSLTMERK